VELGIPEVLVGVVIGMALTIALIVPFAYPDIRIEGHARDGHLWGAVEVDGRGVPDGRIELTAYVKSLVVRPENENIFWLMRR